MKKWLFKSFLIVGGLTGVAACIGLFFCWQYGIWSWRDWQIYKAMSRECHPVWRDLHFGRIKPGDDIENIIWQTQPPRVKKIDDVTVLDYSQSRFSGMSIVAKEGRVVSASAWSCTWSKKFFDTTAPDN